jgi:hypothetical protein
MFALDVEDAREVVRLCVRSWRDVNAADDAALAYLRGKREASEDREDRRGRRGHGCP